MTRKKLIARLLPGNHKNLKIYVGVVILAVVAGWWFFNFVFTNRTEVDWLANSDWSHFPGAVETNEGVLIKPIGRVINHTDTSMAQPNPPVNVRGSHAKVSGNFQIEMTMSGIDGLATASFYGQAPVIYDEWRQERGSISVEVDNGSLTTRIWDGTASNSIDERTYDITEFTTESSLEIVIARRDGQILTQVGGVTVGSMPEHDIFASGEVWFGADAELGSQGWTLTSLKIRQVGDGVVELAEPTQPVASESKNTLRELANKHPSRLPIGAAISVNPLFTDQKYSDIALSQFSMMTPENSLKPQAVQPQRGLFTFEDADSLVEVALDNNMLVHGHALVLAKAIPEWMHQAPLNEREQIMIDHIHEVVGRYKGRVAQWDVVNEPLSDDHLDYQDGRNGLRKHMWIDAMGEDFIDIAFKAAREADPDAKLFLNDYGLERDGQRWDALLSLVKRLKADGVPIDGVGFEAHVYHQPADTIDTAVLKEHIQILADLGLESRISEIDVLGDSPTFQAQQYSGVLAVCLSEPGCTSYGTWGVTDLYGSTVLSDRYPIVLGDSLLWDKNYRPKLALESMQKILSR